MIPSMEQFRKSNVDQVSEKVDELLRDYNGYDFCGEPACSGQSKCDSLNTGILDLIKKEKLSIIDKVLKEKVTLHDLGLSCDYTEVVDTNSLSNIIAKINDGEV